MFVMRALLTCVNLWPSNPARRNENETLKITHKSAHFISPQPTLVPKIDCLLRTQ